MDNEEYLRVMPLTLPSHPQLEDSKDVDGSLERPENPPLIPYELHDKGQGESLNPNLHYNVPYHLAFISVRLSESDLQVYVLISCYFQLFCAIKSLSFYD